MLSWNFVWVGYDFLMLKYVLNVFEEPNTTPYVSIVETCPTVLNVQFCAGGQLLRPFLRRPNMKLYVGLNGPHSNTNSANSFCG
jgi:hypothetical protein